MEMQRIINFETTADLVCGFVVPASKQASKPLFLIKACFYPVKYFSQFSTFKGLCFLCMEDSCIENALRYLFFKIGAKQYRGFFDVNEREVAQ